jgi:hypothetical protein
MLPPEFTEWDSWREADESSEAESVQDCSEAGHEITPSYECRKCGATFWSAGSE